MFPTESSVVSNTRLISLLEYAVRNDYLSVLVIALSRAASTHSRFNIIDIEGSNGKACETDFTRYVITGFQ
jgi:hypothetical protein